MIPAKLHCLPRPTFGKKKREFDAKVGINLSFTLVSVNYTKHISDGPIPNPGIPYSLPSITWISLTSFKLMHHYVEHISIFYIFLIHWPECSLQLLTRGDDGMTWHWRHWVESEFLPSDVVTVKPTLLSLHNGWSLAWCRQKITQDSHCCSVSN